MAPVGGLRVRLVFDSLYSMLNTALTDLGWFDVGRAHDPITFRSEPVDDKEEIQLNTLVLTGEDVFTTDLEMGGPRAEHVRDFYLDIYAENNALGQHVIFDLRDILQGRMPSIGRTGPVFDIFDYTQDPVVKIGSGDIDRVFVDRAPASGEEWRKNWWSLAFIVTDYYGNELG